jgi:uncharacterized protein (DUF3084 family)
MTIIKVSTKKQLVSRKEKLLKNTLQWNQQLTKYINIFATEIQLNSLQVSYKREETKKKTNTYKQHIQTG